MPLRRRELLVLALFGCLGLFVLLRSLALQPYLDAAWQVDDGTVMELASSPLPPLRGLAGAHLERIEGQGGRVLRADAALLHPSPRWSVHDAARERQIEGQQQLASMLRDGPLTLHFDDGRRAALEAQPRGWAGLGTIVWLLAAMALALVMVAGLVLLQYRHRRNLPYALLGLSLAAGLLAIGIETLPGLGQPLAYAQHGLWARMAFDLCSAAALVHLSTLQPLRLPSGRWIAAAVWAGCAALLALAAWQALPQAWWWMPARSFITVRRWARCALWSAARTLVQARCSSRV